MNHSGLEPHLLSSEASHAPFKINQKLCANVPNGPLKTNV